MPTILRETPNSDIQTSTNSSLTRFLTKASLVLFPSVFAYSFGAVALMEALAL